MKKTLGLAVLAVTLGCGTASAQQVNVKIGVLSDMSSLYSDIGGAGSVAAAKLAIADFTKANPNVKVELISGDHQNKPDIGSQMANQWYDVDKVDMIIDTPNSGVALAVSQVTNQKNKLFIVSGAAASDLTGPKCNANTIHWTYDTWMLANGTGKALVKTGGDTWFFLTADYAFGHALERDTAAAVENNGGKVIGKVRHPDGNLVLGHERRQPCLDQALAGGTCRAGQIPDHGAGWRVFRRDPLPEGGGCAEERRRRQSGRGGDEEAAHRRSAVRQGYDSGRRP